MICKRVQLPSPMGLHDRRAAKFVNKATEFTSSIYIRYGHFRLNAKSLMGLMSMDLPPYAEITLCAIGPDASFALASLEKMLLNDFQM